MAILASVQPDLAAVALALGGGAAVALVLRLAGGVVARRRAGLSGRTASLLWAISDALGDPALLLDRQRRIAAANRPARARFEGSGPLSGRSVEELLGGDALLLLRGLGRGPATGRVEVGDAGAAAVLVRASSRPVRDLLVLRLDGAPRPPPLPAAADPPPRPRPPRVDLAALGAALLRPIERAATAAGLLRLASPGAAGSDELRRIEAELADVERRLRWLQAAGRDLPRREGPIDLAALVGELVEKAAPGQARLRAQLRPARAWGDAGRLRTALREVLRAAAEELPAGGQLSVKVGARPGSAVLELVPASESAEAAALARALVVPEGGAVEIEATAGRGGVCRISFPSD